MFGFIKKVFIAAVTFLSPNLLSVNSLECVSMNNQECKTRPKIIDINNNEPVFYPYSIKGNKCSGNCNNINNPYAKLCIPDIIKKINVKVFNLMSRINETRPILWHETCKCLCRLSVAFCNSKQIWNDDKCRCKCREDLVDKMVCDKGFSWNPSNCECECDKSCGIGEYLDYKSCVCKKTLADKLVEECTSAINENKIDNKTLNIISSNECASCTIYVALTSIIIGGVFVYFYWYSEKNNQLSLKKDAPDVKYSKAETMIY